MAWCLTAAVISAGSSCGSREGRPGSTHSSSTARTEPPRYDCTTCTSTTVVRRGEEVEGEEGGCEVHSKKRKRKRKQQGGRGRKGESKGEGKSRGLKGWQETGKAGEGGKGLKVKWRKEKRSGEMRGGGVTEFRGWIWCEELCVDPDRGCRLCSIISWWWLIAVTSNVCDCVSECVSASPFLLCTNFVTLMESD